MASHSKLEVKREFFYWLAISNFLYIIVLIIIAGISIATLTADNASSTEITIGYTGDDYQNACNDENAKITYRIGLGQNSIELTGEATPGMTGSDGTDVNINVSDSNYLVDNVEIGDYIDINIAYSNVYNASYPYQNITEVNYSSTNGPTGWRVLSKSGKGATGYVTIISAGTHYWLGGSTYDTNTLWGVTNDSAVDRYADFEFGVRLVVSLKSGIQIAEDNIGTGLAGSVITLAD